MARSVGAPLQVLQDVALALHEDRIHTVRVPPQSLGQLSQVHPTPLPTDLLWASARAHLNWRTRRARTVLWG